MSTAYRALFDSGFAKCDLPDPGGYLFLWERLFVTDVSEGLTWEELDKAGIFHVLAILPKKADFESHVPNLGATEYTVLEYGDEESPYGRFDEFLRLAIQLDDFHRKTSRGYRKKWNVLVYCADGYQRCLPILSYYMMKYCLRGDRSTITGSLQSLCASIPGFAKERLAVGETVDPRHTERGTGCRH